MRLFVTGGTGFIGSHFLNAALDADHEVIALRRSAESRPRIPLNREPRWLTKEMRDVDVSDLRDIDAFVHLAAYGVTQGIDDWNQCFRVNVQESLDLWLKATRADVRRFVICGSCFEYGKSAERYDFIPVDAPLEPTGAYHASKAAATMAAIGLGYQLSLELIVLRPFHVFGEGEDETRFWPSLRGAAQSGSDFPMTLGEQIRDFLPVRLAAASILQASTSDGVPRGRPILKNLGSGVPVTLRDFAADWWQKFGAEGRLRPGEVPYRGGEVMRYVPQI